MLVEWLQGIDCDGCGSHWLRWRVESGNVAYSCRNCGHTAHSGHPSDSGA